MGSGELCLGDRGQVSDRGFIFSCCELARSYDIIVSFQSALIEIKVQGLYYVTQRLLCSCSFQRIAWIWAEQLKRQQALASFLLAIFKTRTNETQLSSFKREGTTAHVFFFFFPCFPAVLFTEWLKRSYWKDANCFKLFSLLYFSFTAPTFQAKVFQGNSDFNALYTYHITPQGNYHLQDN